MRSASCILVLFFLVPPLCHGDTTWVAAGDVSGIWTPENSPYMIQGMISVSTLDTLDIQPGVHVLFERPFGLTVNGVLSANGTENDSIVFSDYPIGDSTMWAGIDLQAGSARPCQMSYCLIERSLYWLEHWAALNIVGQLSISHSTVRDCEGYGIRLVNGDLHANQLLVSTCGIHSGINAVSLGPSTVSSFTNCEFWGNHGLDGAAVKAYNATCTISECLFENNLDAIYGGSFLGDGPSGQYVIRNSVFHQNQSMYGAGIAFMDFAEPPSGLVDHCVFYENVVGGPSQYGYGGGIYGNAAFIPITNCTFVGNYSWFDQGAALSGHFGGITNCIFMGHEMAAIHFTSGCPVRYNCFFGNGGNVEGAQPAGIGVINQVNANGDSCDGFFNIFSLNPLMVDPEHEDFHLLASSPCIDAGDPSSPHDPDSTIADIGAFYFDQTPSVSRDESLLPTTFALSAYPNPFNSTVRLTISVPEPSRVRAAIYNLVGEEVTVLEDGQVSAGDHALSWNAASESSGTYFAVLTSGVHRETRKLLLLR